MHSSSTRNQHDSSAPSISRDDQIKSKPRKFVRFWRRIYRPLGFQKGYNFPLFIIFAGGFFGFTLSRLSYLNISGTASSSFANGASPGEWYWYQQSIYRVGIIIHLAAILPASLLAVWQFVPAIRRRFLLFHRINGHIIILLVLVGNAGAIMVCRHAFGGTLSTQAAVGVLVILSTVSIGLAYYNIKRLQIDQHRAWMLRAMFYLGTIVTLRLIMIISALITSQVANHATTMSCGELLSIHDGSSLEVQQSYPGCGASNATAGTLVLVKATFGNGQPEQIGASLRMSFGMAMWMALILHLVGVEIYLNLTPRESIRLRQVSYERQMEKGLKPFGSAGLTSDRWGDAEPWRPATKGPARDSGKPSDDDLCNEDLSP